MQASGALAPGDGEAREGGFVFECGMCEDSESSVRLGLLGSA